jgi:hypothetical protein
MVPEDVQAMTDYIHEQRTSTAAFEVVVGGSLLMVDPGRAKERLAAYREHGATWWLEHMHGWLAPLEELRAALRRGPPRG